MTKFIVAETFNKILYINPAGILSIQVLEERGDFVYCHIHYIKNTLYLEAKLNKKTLRSLLNE